MAPILPANPRANYLAHRDEIDSAIARVLQGGRYINGQEVSAFEREFADYVGVSHAVGVASGTDALHLALLACGVGRGDLVFTVSHTAVATVSAIDRCGALPVFVDIDPGSFTMDPSELASAVESASSGQPKAVIPVHLYGHPADMGAILAVAKRHALHVVEDCAQSHGALVTGQQTGALGHIGAFSFYPTKNLGAIGDGGMVVTSDAALAERVRLLKEYGWEKRFISKVPGLNSRLDELQAAVLRVKLRYLDEENSRRSAIAAHYAKLLGHTDLVLPGARTNVTHVYHQYVIRTADRDALRTYLWEQGIQTLIHYPLPVHLQPAYAGRIPQAQELPNTVAIAGQILSLPIYPELGLDQVHVVAGQIDKWVQRTKSASGRPDSEAER